MLNLLETTPLSARGIMQMFPTEQIALEFLEQARWQGRPQCPQCNNVATDTTRSNGSPRRYICRKCNMLFDAKTKSIFSGARVPLQKWFLAAYYMMKPEGISMMELADEIGVMPCTALSVMDRIGLAMARRKEGIILKGVVEMDEAGLGGKEMKKPEENRLFPGGGFGGKQGVFCMVERGDHGRVVTSAVPDMPVQNTKGEWITAPNFSREVIFPIIRKYVDPSSIVCTDEGAVYRALVRKKLARLHFSVNHNDGEYVNYPDHPKLKKAYSNTAESRWSALKRLYRNNNQWGKDKVQMHLDISDFRWNETRVYIKNRKGEVVFARRRAPTMEAFEVFISCCFGIEVSRKDLKSMRGVK